MLETYSQWIIVATRADAFSSVPLDRDWRVRQRRTANAENRTEKKRSSFASLFG